MTSLRVWARQHVKFQERLILSLKGERAEHNLGVEVLLKSPGLNGLRGSRFHFVQKATVSYRAQFSDHGRIARQGFPTEEAAARFVLDTLVERKGVAGALKFIKVARDRMARQEGGRK